MKILGQLDVAPAPSASGSFSATSTGTTKNSPVLCGSFTLAGGAWNWLSRIRGNITVSGGSGRLSCFLSTSSSSASAVANKVAGSEAVIVYAETGGSGVTNEASGCLNASLAPTSSTTYYLYANLTGSGTILGSQTGDDADGRTAWTAVRVGG